MLKSWSLKRKTISAFAAVSVALLVVGAVGAVTVHQVSEKYRQIPEHDVKSVALISDMRSSGWHLRVLMNRIRSDASDSTANQDDMKVALKEVAEVFKEYNDADKKYNSAPLKPKEMAQYKIVNEKWAATQHEMSVMMNMVKAGSTHADFEKSFVKTYRTIVQDHLHALDELADVHQKSASQLAQEAAELASLGNTIALTCMGLGFLVALIVGFLFSNALSKTLSTLSERLQTGAGSVAGASQKIAGASSELSASATQQAAALQETVSSVDEVSAMINKNADNAKQSQEVAGQSQESASKGRDAVAGLVTSIDEISRSNGEIMGQIEDSNRQMSEIVKVITEIGQKTKVINDIVFQTKLLSFNASVEAARAGEHGKGFAVVAEEVGNLAQMSGNAAKEISAMLESSSRRVEGIVSETKSKIERLVVVGKEKVHDGTTRARQCGDILEEIVGNVTQVGQLMTEIATASSEQSQGVQEITRAMAQLDQVTQQNAMASQDSANSSEQLSDQAEELREIIGQLTRTIEGDHGRSSVQHGPKYAQLKPEKQRRASAKTLEFKKPANALKAQSSSFAVRKAVGDETLPSENDPRFEES